MFDKLFDNIKKTGELPALRTEIDVPIRTLLNVGIAIVLISIAVVLVQKIGSKM